MEKETKGGFLWKVYAWWSCWSPWWCRNRGCAWTMAGASPLGFWLERRLGFWFDFWSLFFVGRKGKAENEEREDDDKDFAFCSRRGKKYVSRVSYHATERYEVHGCRDKRIGPLRSYILHEHSLNLHFAVFLHAFNILKLTKPSSLKSH